MTLGEKIKYLRTFRGWSQEALAKSAGANQRSVCKWEHNDYNITLKKLVRLSKAFGLEPDELLNGCDFD